MFVKRGANDPSLFFLKQVPYQATSQPLSVLTILGAIFFGDLTEMISHCRERETVGKVAGMKSDKFIEVFPKLNTLVVA